MVLAAGVALTIALMVSTRSAFDTNEDRLLQQRTREAAAVLTVALPSIQTPLAAAAAVADQDDAEHAAFRHVMAPLTSGRPFVSASLWRADGTALEPLVVVGSPPALASRPPAEIRAFLNRSVASDKLAVIGLLTGEEPRLGYSFASTTGTVRFVAYAEAALPKNRTSVVPSGSAFSGLDNAVYLGHSEDAATLLTASTPDLPLHGRRATTSVEFGDTSLLLVMKPAENLSGGLLAALPWLTLSAGLITTLGATALVERLLRRRDQAEALADANEQLYTEQVSVARTLQRSLLPQALPQTDVFEIEARYVPGVADLEIGGDWYDAIGLDDGRLMIVVGDVSGRGLEAGTSMAALRYAVRAFASRGDEPSTILTGLSRLLDLERDGHFATVLCAIIHDATATITIANAGHPNPLLINEAGAAFLPTAPGSPIGITGDAEYSTTTHDVAPGSIILAFTDGLFERRGETVHDGMERLRHAASRPSAHLGEFLDAIVAEQITSDSHDDSAILGVRWKNKLTT